MKTKTPVRREHPLLCPECNNTGKIMYLENSRYMVCRNPDCYQLAGSFYKPEEVMRTWRK